MDDLTGYEQDEDGMFTVFYVEGVTEDFASLIFPSADAVLSSIENELEYIGDAKDETITFKIQRKLVTKDYLDSIPETD